MINCRMLCRQRMVETFQTGNLPSVQPVLFVLFHWTRPLLRKIPVSKKDVFAKRTHLNVNACVFIDRKQSGIWIQGSEFGFLPWRLGGSNRRNQTKIKPIKPKSNRKMNQPISVVALMSNHLAHRSPSPGGEGRGEGELKTDLYPSNPSPTKSNQVQPSPTKSNQVQPSPTKSKLVQHF